MLRKLSADAPNFKAELQKALDARLMEETSVTSTVTDILRRVREKGDAAVIDYTAKFDRLTLTPEKLAISAAEISAAEADCGAEVKEALLLAAERIRLFHADQLPKDTDFTDDTGTRLGMRWNAISDVGLYVPGGTASYPSSVLMNAIPAKAAGVTRLVMVVPTPDGKINPAILVAAKIADVDEIYRIGGAQAVAALAFGTETIHPVHKIVGPGNAYVAEAKRQVFGRVGIDTIAGPSEILVVADNKNDPAWIAADLLSQAEHDRDAQSILITDNPAFADAVDQAIAAQLMTLPRREIAEVSIRTHGICVLVKDLKNAAAIVDQVAPEHIELAVDNPEKLAADIKHAGAIFLGRYTPEAIGDYVAGPSHVLPTTGAAKFSSGLSVYDFIKKTSIIGCSEESFRALAGATKILANTEGLGAHALSVSIRGNQ